MVLIRNQNLPDDLAKRAQSAGLLTSEAIESMQEFDDDGIENEAAVQNVQNKAPQNAEA